MEGQRRHRYTPPGLCRAICRGLIKQRQLDAMHVKQILRVTAQDTVGEIPEHEEDTWKPYWAWDDASHKHLDPEQVRKARNEEMDYVNAKQVWVKVDKRQAINDGHTLANTMWIDTDKGVS